MRDYNYKQLNEIIHSRIRLAVMIILVDNVSADFTFLRSNIQTTEGNLSIHLQKLSDEEYISTEKKNIDGKQISTYKITSKGKHAYEIYLSRLNRLISG